MRDQRVGRRRKGAFMVGEYVKGSEMIGGGGVKVGRWG